MAVNPDTVQMAMYGGTSEVDPRGGKAASSPSLGGASHQLRLLLAAAVCQFVEAKHGITLKRDTWKLMVRLPTMSSEIHPLSTSS